MFKIYNKTMQEMIEELNSLDVSAFPSKRISTTYIIDEKGEKISTSDLTEEQILDLIISDIRDFYDAEGNYQKENKVRIESSIKLGEALGEHFEPSYNMIITLLELSEDFIPFTILEVIKAFNGFKKIDAARTIAKYEKEKNGNFETLTDSEIIDVLKQLQENEKNRKEEFKIMK